jgi:hypothetical protein
MSPPEGPFNYTVEDAKQPFTAFRVGLANHMEKVHKDDSSDSEYLMKRAHKDDPPDFKHPVETILPHRMERDVETVKEGKYEALAETGKKRKYEVIEETVEINEVPTMAPMATLPKINKSCYQPHH